MNYSINQAIGKMTFREKQNGLLEGRVSFQGERRSFYGHSKTECKNKARQHMESVSKGEYNPVRITLNEYMEKWLFIHKSTTIESSSFARLVSVYEHQIKEDLGKKKLVEITADDIQSLINGHARGIYGKKPLARSGLKKIKHLLGPCFEQACRDGILKKNPCDDVSIPKTSNIVVKTKEQFTLSDEEIQSFKTAALIRKKNGQIKYRDALSLVLAISIGVRVGELITLKWSDVNWEGNYIHVHTTLQVDPFSEERRKIKNGTKTAAERMIPMNENVRKYLDMLQEFDKSHEIDSEYIACTTTGTLHRPRNLSRSLEKLVERAGLPKEISLHTLRHTFGSSLIRAGVGVEVVSRLMGHANIMVTYNKYVHVIREQEAKAMTLVTII